MIWTVENQCASNEVAYFSRYSVLMSIQSSPWSLERAEQSVWAAEALASNAEAIARVCQVATLLETVLAVVGPSGAFLGAWVLPAERLRESALLLDETSWTWSFDAGTEAERIRLRGAESAELARRKLETLRRYHERRQLGESN